MGSAVVNFTARTPAGAPRAAEAAEPSSGAAPAKPRRVKGAIAAAIAALGAVLGMAHLATVLLVAPAGHVHSYLALLVLALLVPTAIAWPHATSNPVRWFRS